MQLSKTLTPIELQLAKEACLIESVHSKENPLEADILYSAYTILKSRQQKSLDNPQAEA